MRIRVHLPESTFEWESSVRCFRVGRGDGCALRFEGPSSQFASWEHAEFSVGSDGAVYVTDLGSSNGTFVDGAPIRGAAPLRVGSTISIGRAGPRLEVLALAAPATRPVPIARPIPITAPAPAAAVDSTDRASASEETQLERSPRHWLHSNAALGAIVVLAAVVTILLANLLFRPVNSSGLWGAAAAGAIVGVAGLVMWAYRRRGALPVFTLTGFGHQANHIIDPKGQQPPPSGVTVVTPTKNMGIAIILTVLFGPLGMLYSTVPGGIIMMLVQFLVFAFVFAIGFFTAGVGLVLLPVALAITWPVCLLWAALATSSYNKKLLAGLRHF